MARQIRVDIFTEDMEEYEEFVGEEDQTGDDNVWKEAKLGSVRVTMFKPDAEEEN